MNQDVERSDERKNPSAVPAERARLARRVLVVDDDPDAAEELAELLSMNGHEVRIATAPEEALRLFEILPPQVAVLDIGLPHMDGYELQARMRGLRGGRACLYVALTGYGMQSEQEHSRRAGFRAHLVKPVCLAQLVDLIEGSAASSDSTGSAAPAGSVPDPVADSEAAPTGASQAGRPR